MEHCEHDPFEKYFENFTIDETRSYIKQALEILAEIHERGIMHRDIKPQNLLYNRETKVLRMIDFGRAEEYTDQAKSVRVGSKFFKAPELLVGYSSSPDNFLPCFHHDNCTGNFLKDKSKEEIKKI